MVYNIINFQHQFRNMELQLQVQHMFRLQVQMHCWGKGIYLPTALAIHLETPKGFAKADNFMHLLVCAVKAVRICTSFYCGRR